MCTYDYCACASVSMAQDGACGAIADYARACAKAGIVLDWSEHSQCLPNCPGDTIWNQCSSGGDHSCATIGNNVTDVATESVCVEGCYCPDGYILDRDGTSCVQQQECSCTSDGEIVPAGSKKTEGCLSCTCENGNWNCQNDQQACIDNKVCPAGMKWADCKNACQKQCNNMHIFDTAACQAGINGLLSPHTDQSGLVQESRFLDAS